MRSASQWSLCSGNSNPQSGTTTHTSWLGLREWEMQDMVIYYVIMFNQLFLTSSVSDMYFLWFFQLNEQVLPCKSSQISLMWKSLSLCVWWNDLGLVETVFWNMILVEQFQSWAITKRMADADFLLFVIIDFILRGFMLFYRIQVL